MSRALVVGFGVTGRAVTRALVRRGHDVVAVDDAPSARMAADAAADAVELVASPSPGALGALVADADLFVPSPGIPECHAAFALAEARGLAVTSELDLATDWDSRPVLAVTGTNGKTTVTDLLVSILEATGLGVVAAGNTDVPLVAAIDDAAVDLFVVEASSFRLAPTTRFAPAVATWLNFAPDHLDVHRSLEVYERSKAKVFARAGACVGNLDDPVVAAHLAAVNVPVVGFGVGAGAGGGAAAVTVAGGDLTVHGRSLLAVSELWRSLPHDIANAMAAVATIEAAAAAGVVTVSESVMAGALRGFVGQPHRVALVAEVGGVRWYDDSKATTPHAVLAALAGFESVVLIAGGRDKGVDLAPLLEGAASIKAVVGLGEAGPAVVGHFDGLRPTVLAADMAAAVGHAAELAEPGDVVLLSPACASFDQYADYSARGDDFTARVHRLSEGQ
ncbi:MAG: UDP-N-acetylmuramoyl-L-alanine--D-glutamate ligase [Acidimicrobiales bacterium]